MQDIRLLQSSEQGFLLQFLPSSSIFDDRPIGMKEGFTNVQTRDAWLLRAGHSTILVGDLSAILLGDPGENMTKHRHPGNILAGAKVETSVLIIHRHKSQHYAHLLAD